MSAGKSPCAGLLVVLCRLYIYIKTQSQNKQTVYKRWMLILSLLWFKKKNVLLCRNSSDGFMVSGPSFECYRTADDIIFVKLNQSQKGR